jgi:hypothetical protein
MTGAPEITFFERLLARHDWTPPQTRMRVFKGTFGELKKAVWYRRYRLSTRFHLASWSEITRQDMSRLRETQRKTAWIPDELLPWKFEMRQLHAASSIAVRFDGEIVGWILMHPLDRETLRCSCAFMRDDLSSQLCLLPVLSEAVARAEESGFRRFTAAISVRSYEATARFAERWIAPCLSSIEETRSSFKELNTIAQG